MSEHALVEEYHLADQPRRPDHLSFREQIRAMQMNQPQSASGFRLNMPSHQPKGQSPYKNLEIKRISGRKSLQELHARASSAKHECDEVDSDEEQ